MQSSMAPIIARTAQWLIAHAHHTPAPTDHSAHWTKFLTDLQAGKIPGTMDLATSTLNQAQALKDRLTKARQPIAAIYEDLTAKQIILLDDQYRTIQQFDRNRQGHLDAIKALLRLENPAALTLALAAESRHPDLAGRAIRAALIVAESAIIQCHEGYQVSSQSGRKPYLVTKDLAACRCPDWINGQQNKPKAAPIVAGSPCCKHRIAVALMRRLERTRS